MAPRFDTAPDGNIFGGPGLVVEEYLVSMHADIDATTPDPISGKTYLIRELDFEQRVDVGKAASRITGYRTAPESRLDEVARIVGFPLKYCYLAG